METTPIYRFKLPLVHWLLLAFLSAGIANGIYQHQSVRPVSTIENLISCVAASQARTKAVHYYTYRPTTYKPQLLNEQLKHLLLRSIQLTLTCNMAIQDYPSKVPVTLSNRFYFPFLRIFPEEPTPAV